MRLIERDDETFLAWARDRYACVIFNLHVDHTPPRSSAPPSAFRALIDLGIAHGGSYYLTYHRWARRDQVERCYPQLPEFLAHKRQHDPEERLPEQLVPPLPRDVCRTPRSRDRMTEPQAFSPVLWLCSVLLLLRVAGQLLVVLRAPAWLPPMAQWQSGLVPYRFLLATQVVVLTLMFWIAADFARGAGVWVRPMPGLGHVVLAWSCLYATAMVVRYAIRMFRRPDQRWLGGTIPIIFHSVVAAFQLTFALYHVAGA